MSKPVSAVPLICDNDQSLPEKILESWILVFPVGIKGVDISGRFVDKKMLNHLDMALDALGVFISRASHC